MRTGYASFTYTHTCIEYPIDQNIGTAVPRDWLRDIRDIDNPLWTNNDSLSSSPGGPYAVQTPLTSGTFPF